MGLWCELLTFINKVQKEKEEKNLLVLSDLFHGTLVWIANIYKQSPKGKGGEKSFHTLSAFFMDLVWMQISSSCYICWGHISQSMLLRPSALVSQLSILWFEVGRDASGGPKSLLKRLSTSSNNGMEDSRRIIWRKMDSSAYNIWGGSSPCLL